MARSEEAIKRRALKRQRSEQEQREAERNSFEKKKKFRKEDNGDSKVGSPSNRDPSKETTPGPPTQEKDPMREVGAWKCPKCGNENFASRNWCNSKTCDAVRPYDIPAPPPFKSRGNDRRTYQRLQRPPPRKQHPLDEPGAWKCGACGTKNFASRNSCYAENCKEPRPKESLQEIQKSDPKRRGDISKVKAPRHDEATSKKLSWAKQADPDKLSKNQKLRKLYQETGGKDMSPEDIERAKILIARDERKRRKKEELKNTDAEEDQKQEEETVEATETKEEVAEDTPSESNENTEDTTATTETSKKDKKKSVKSSRDRNKFLREKYMETFGKGMKPADIERAKLLIERDERKRKRRLAKE